jgi:hypothetical protein
MGNPPKIVPSCSKEISISSVGAQISDLLVHEKSMEATVAIDWGKRRIWPSAAEKTRVYEVDLSL